MDIKYVHVHDRRNASLLTVMDIYSRKVLIHMLRQSIKKGDVLLMLSLMLLDYKAEGMSLRNDNGSQFIANAVREYLKEKGITRSSLMLPRHRTMPTSKPYTPTCNAR